MKIHMGVQDKDGTVTSVSRHENYATADEFWADRGRRKAYLLNAETGEWFAMDYNDNWPRPAPAVSLDSGEIVTPVEALTHGH